MEADMEDVLRMLKDSDPEVRESALDRIGELKPDNALELVVPFLADGDPEVRGTAAYSLGEIDDDRAVPYLLKVANSDDSESVRAEALLSLAQYRSEEILGALVAEVGRDKRSRRPRYEVAKQLGHYDSPESLRGLEILLRDDDVHVRIAAADSLYRLNRPDLRRVWSGALQDESDYVREVAERALADLGED
jgi:HEAT repeat protein